MPKSQDRLVRRHHAASGLDQHVIHHPPSNISGKHWDRNGSFPVAIILIQKCQPNLLLQGSLRRFDRPTSDGGT